MNKKEEFMLHNQFKNIGIYKNNISKKETNHGKNGFKLYRYCGRTC